MKFFVDKVRSFRVFSLVTIDIIMINFSVLFSMLIRFELSLGNLIESGFVGSYRKIALIYTVITVLIFSVFRLYRSLWEFAGIDEIRNIALAVALSNVALALLPGIMGTYLPRSLSIINFLLLFVSVSSFRFAYRAIRRLRKRMDSEQKATMLIGAGAGGSLVLRDLKTSNLSINKVVCIIDDDERKHGTYLMGIKVVGGREKIPEMAKKYDVSDIIIAMPTASPSEKRAIVEFCQKTNCRIQILPGIYQIASGQVSIQPIREIRVEDLLGREKVSIDSGEIGNSFCGKTILITGGGGSIGSELCRQVAQYNIKRLVIFDIYENNAFDIQQELNRRHPDLDQVVLIGSVRDEARVNEIFETYHPDIVCHAAAHKHVPLMEDSPAEAIKNNVFGTLNVAKAADRFGAEKFILVSSDKAVNPTNIMGASKRICEMIIQTIGKISKTDFAAVRFGNVLGSNGSVIPLFKKQIAEGGPVTVTHKDIIRYFMTISEAVSLILQACVYAKSGEVFVLDMGEPVRIDDLARNMIKLSGFEPDSEIKIVYIGLRNGEKLYEELMMQDECLEKTPNDLIFIGQFNDFDREKLLDSLKELESACVSSPENIRRHVHKLVRTYHENGEEICIPEREKVILS